MTDIFISYASEDRDSVEPLVKALERQGWSLGPFLELTTFKLFRYRPQIRGKYRALTNKHKERGEYQGINIHV